MTSNSVAAVQHGPEEAGAEPIGIDVCQRHRDGTSSDTLLADLRAIAAQGVVQRAAWGLPTDLELYDEDGLPA